MWTVAFNFKKLHHHGSRRNLQNNSVLKSGCTSQTSLGIKMPFSSHGQYLLDPNHQRSLLLFILILHIYFRAPFIATRGLELWPPLSFWISHFGHYAWMGAQPLWHQHTSLLCSGLYSSLSIMRYKPRHRTPRLFNEPQNICPKVFLGWGEKREKHMPSGT